MRNKTTHIKFLSLILTIVMVMSTVMVFAETEPATGESSEQEFSTEALQAEPTPAETPNEPSVEAPEETLEESAPSIAVTPTEATVKIGQNVTLTAELQNAPEGTSVLWSTSDSAVVSVSESGVVTGVAAGTATVSATAQIGEDTISAECLVTVPEPIVPATPANVTASTRYGSGDNGLTISWTSDGTNTNHFEVLWGYSADINSMKPIRAFTNVSPGTRSIYYLESKGTYYYAVKAVSSDGTAVVSAPSAKLSVSGNVLPFIEELVWYGHTKKKVNIYKTAGLKGKVATLAKGTYVVAIDKSPAKVKKFKQPSKVRVRTSNGTVGWLKYSQLKGGVKAATTVNYDYTRSALEDFVNGHGYTSPNKYLIWVSPRTQRAYLFTGSKGNWELSKRFRVTTGRFSHKTSAYHSKISQKKDKVFMVTEKGKRYYYKYASYFASGVSFHTGTWWKSNNKVRGVMNKAGVPQTFGCLRMANGDAEWIYRNIPINTTVIVKKDAA